LILEAAVVRRSRNMGTVRNNEILIASEPVAVRRHRSKQERRRIAEESLEPGASVAVIARSHGVNANQVFHWRKLLREGQLDLKPASSAQLMPVRIAELADHEQRSARPYSGVIHLELGRVRIRVEGSADPESLRVILERLGR
jgi:transposase